MSEPAAEKIYRLKYLKELTVPGTRKNIPFKNFQPVSRKMIA
jgi:hypothetical protein